MQTYNYAGIQETSGSDEFRKNWGDFPEGAFIFSLKGDRSNVKSQDQLKGMGATASITRAHGVPTHYTISN